MAFQSRKKHEETHFPLSVDVNGVLATSVRAELVTEFVKDVLYQRQQISMPCDQIRQDLKKSESESQGEEQISRSSLRQNAENRKKKDFVDKMDELSQSLKQIFAMSASVRSILLCLGPTAISPKETYLLRFPTSVFDGQILSLAHCKMALFKQLVQSSFFVDVQPPKLCTKLFVFVEMLENVNHNLHLIPKPNFKVPSRGCQLAVDFFCHTQEISGNLTKANELDFDISGIEPLNHSALDSEHSVMLKRLASHGSDDVCMSHSSPVLGGTPHSCSSRDHLMDIGNTPQKCDSPMMVCDTPPTSNEHFGDALPYAWFQVPLHIQGFRDNLPPMNSGDMAK